MGKVEIRGVYCPPDVSDFMAKLEEILSISRAHLKYILGDFNTNLLRQEGLEERASPEEKALIRLMDDHSFSIIQNREWEHTWTRRSKSSVLDIILTSDWDNITRLPNISATSDHLGIEACLRMPELDQQTEKEKEIDQEQWEALMAKDWVDLSRDPDMLEEPLARLKWLFEKGVKEKKWCFTSKRQWILELTTLRKEFRKQNRRIDSNY